MTEQGSGSTAPDSISSSTEEGQQYRGGVYQPLDESTPCPTRRTARTFPDPGHGPPFKFVRRMSRVPRLRHIIGPSVIALGMGLGSGEFLLWPNLVAANGFSIWWLFWIGVVTQFVVIGEIERWTIATGESTFAGMARLDRLGFWPWLFLVATLASFFWPGWASQSAEFVGQIVVLVGGPQIQWQPMALLMLACIWFGLAVSRIVYNVLERCEIALVAGFFPLLAITLLVVGLVPSHFLELAVGAASFGSAPAELFTGDQFPTLILAVAYAGTGARCSSHSRSGCATRASGWRGSRDGSPASAGATRTSARPGSSSTRATRRNSGVSGAGCGSSTRSCWPPSCS